MSQSPTPPPHADAALLLADGTVFFGRCFGAEKSAIGELCFTTGMTGYQETLTDPSFADQIITFTFPHIGNTGANAEDIEAKLPFSAGLVTRERPTPPSNFRSRASLDEWLKKYGIPGIFGVDTRALTRHIRTKGAQNAMIIHGQAVDSEQLKDALEELKAFPSMSGRELAKTVTTAKPYEWNEGLWKLSPTAHRPPSTAYHVVALDYGVKANILRNLAEAGCRVTVVPATASAEEILKLKPDGIFLSNGPGDPAATGDYALPVIKKLIDSGIPIFGICLGHQLLGLAMGAKTEKMTQGHRGANHPVKELATGRVIITSQNHGFVVSEKNLPAELEVTHRSLFDGTVQGLRHRNKPIFCLQGHPEASPGPHDTQYFFGRFVEMIEAHHAA